MHNEWPLPSRTYSRFFGWSVVDSVRTRASLPAPATHFIASFRPDDYLALYEGRLRRSTSGRTNSRKPSRMSTNLKIQMFIESNYDEIISRANSCENSARFADDSSTKTTESYSLHACYSFIETSPIIPRFIVLIMFASGYKFNKSLGTLMTEKRKGSSASSDDKATRSSKR